MQRKQYVHGSKFTRNTSEHAKSNVKGNKSLVINKSSAHKEDIKQLIEKQYSEATRGRQQKLNSFIGKKDVGDALFDEEKFMEYMYCNKEHKVKRSSSFRGIKLDDLIEEKVLKEKMGGGSNDFDDEIKKLDKLSMLNMGARYEFLNANKMMVDLSLGLVRIR